MFESLESRQLMSATFTSLITPPPPKVKVTAVEESPEQAAKAASTQTGSTLSDLDKAAIAIAIARAVSRL